MMSRTEGTSQDPQCQSPHSFHIVKHPRAPGPCLPCPLPCPLPQAAQSSLPAAPGGEVYQPRVTGEGTEATQNAQKASLAFIISNKQCLIDFDFQATRKDLPKLLLEHGPHLLSSGKPLSLKRGAITHLLVNLRTFLFWSLHFLF